MDQATQQNAALVEESAAAAGALRKQAQDLVGAVAVFQLPGGAMYDHAPAPVARAPGVPASMGGMRQAPVAARVARKPVASVASRPSPALMQGRMNGTNGGASGGAGDTGSARNARKTSNDEGDWETF